ncbi:MAG TPA: hypothetical protein VF041_19070 [Gemmatimonadaceae bacterium]
MPSHIQAALPRGRRLTARPSPLRAIAAALPLAGALLAPVACATWWPSFRGSAPTPMPDTYRCAVARVRALGFTPVAFNEGDGDMEARREDRAASARLVAERRQYDVLVVDAATPTPSASSSDGDASGRSTLSVRAETIVRRVTREGWIEEGQPASPGVQTAARQIVQECAGER